MNRPSGSLLDIGCPINDKFNVAMKGKRLAVRCVISNLTKFIDNLSSRQKKAVMEMGFQEILCLKLNAIPSAFAYCLLQNYNPEADSINDGESEIHLSSS
ncbi:hypothetical protein R6Q57_008311 [Mikania cordata]